MEVNILDEPLKIAICEDTKSDASILLDMISHSGFQTTCTVYTSGEALLAAYHPQAFDLLLTDIYMEGMTGVETIHKIREMGDDVPVAFTTTSTDHALEGYRLSVLKYIEKPYVQKQVDDILKLAQLSKSNVPSLVIYKNGKEEAIPLSEILYLEQQMHLLYIYKKNNEVATAYEKLSNLLPQLEHQSFFSSHKSFSVNLSFVRFIDTDLKCFMMQNGKNVPIRREAIGKAKKALKNFLFQKTRGTIQ